MAAAAAIAGLVTVSTYFVVTPARPKPASAVAVVPAQTTAKVDRLDAYAREAREADLVVAPSADRSAVDWSSASRRIAIHDTINAKGEREYGIRISVPEGTPVRAAADGVVEFVGDDGDGHGNKVVLRHGAIATVYGHVSALYVRAKERVRKGQVIAKSGRSGLASSPRLYLALVASDTNIDPIEFFASTMKPSALASAAACASEPCNERRNPARTGPSPFAPRPPAAIPHPSGS